MGQFLPGHPDGILVSDGIVQDMHERLQFKAIRKLLKKIDNEHQDMHGDFGQRISKPLCASGSSGRKSAGAVKVPIGVLRIS